VYVTGRRGRRHKKLLDDLREMRGYWKLKEEALDRSLENSLWKKLWTSRNSNCRINECG
jgi:hypothetical protein